MSKKLYKSSTDKKVCGVCAGFAEYLDVDPVFIRLLWAALVCFCGTGIVAYFLAAIIMDTNPEF